MIFEKTSRILEKMEKYDKMYNDQKVEGNNLCDTGEYWLEVYDKEELE